MLVLPKLSFALLGGSDPHAHCLVIGAAGQQRAVLIGPHHPHPFPVARKRLHAVTTRAQKTSLDFTLSNTATALWHGFGPIKQKKEKDKTQHTLNI